MRRQSIVGSEGPESARHDREISDVRQVRPPPALPARGSRGRGTVGCHGDDAVPVHRAPDCALGVPARREPADPGGDGRQRDRRVRGAKPERARHRAGSAGEQGDPDSPGDVRPPWSAPDASRSGSVSRRRIALGLCGGGRPVARLAALRRAVGAPLARSGQIRGERGLQVRRDPSERVAVPRLRHRLSERGQALRPLHAGADRGRRTLAAQPGGEDRHRVQPPLRGRVERGDPHAARRSCSTSPTRSGRSSWA